MKILVIHPGSLGDVVLSMPAFYALRQAYPTAHLDVVGNPSTFELLKGRFYVDGVISIDRADFTTCLTGQSDPTQPFACALREYAFVINWLGDQDGDFSSYLYRLGVKKIFSSRPISNSRTDLHRSKIFLNTLALLEIPIPLTPPCLFPALEDQREGREVLLRSGAPLGEKPVLAIHPGSGRASKCWDLSGFVEVARLALENLGMWPVFLLGPAEQGIRPSLKEFIGDKVAMLDCLPLPVVAGALTWCSGYLGNDSGMTHLSASLGIPTVAIFGPTDPARWGPLGDRVTVLSKRKEGNHVGHDLCQGCVCLKLVAVQDVLPLLSKIALDYSPSIC